MSDDKNPFEVLPVGEMRRKYYKSDEIPPQINLNPSNVPEPLRILIPLAERWGIGDDILRADYVAKASREEIRELQQLIAKYDDFLDEWLAGPEAKNPRPSVEYLAFTHMRMAADGC